MSVTKVGPMRSRDQGEAWSRRALLTLGLGDRWLCPDCSIKQVTYWLLRTAPCSAPYEASLGQCSHQVTDTLLLGKIPSGKLSGKPPFLSPSPPLPLRVPGPLTVSWFFLSSPQCLGVGWRCALLTGHRKEEHPHLSTLQLGSGYLRLHLP